ncbi:MAG: hypothetical protein F4Y49_15790 [Dehalococcoidia bacterium]|nr:hypothetical protein [Dehalococcoidia bacterium]
MTQKKEAESMTIDNSQIGPLGQAIYEEKIRDALGPEDHGKLVVIDVVSGDYEVDSDHIAALMRIRERHPDARTLTKRAGFRGAYHMGSGNPT